MKEGWRMVKLGEIVSFSQGVQVPLSEQKTDMLEGYSRFLRIVDYTQGNEPPRYIKINDDKYRVSEKDIAIVRYGTPGFVCRGLSGVIANNLFKINIDNKNFIDVDYLAYVLKSDIFQKTVKKKQNGAALQAITFGTIKEIPIPYPILIEKQHRIVSILDASFEKIDALKKNAEENLKNAKALFQQVLAQELKPKEGWVEKKLGEIYDVRDGTHDSPKYHSEGYPLVTSKNLKENGLDLSNVKYIKEEDFHAINTRSKVNIGDILFAMIGTIGNPVIVREEPNYAIKNMALFKVDNNNSSDFLRYYLLLSIEKMRKESNGTTQKFVSLNYLRNFGISLPSLSEQHRIVRTLDTLSEKCRRLEQVAQQTIRECDALKQSILRQAFSGEL